MEKRMSVAKFPIGFFVFMLFITLWNAPIIAAPFLLESGSQLAGPIYSAYGFPFICHQLNSRSLCYFPSKGIMDCTKNSGKLEYAKTNSVVREGEIGYKLPVCARDIGIYFAMLIGGILAFALGKHKSKQWPSPWILVLFLLPMVVDGGTQALGLRESTNFLRLATGFLGGIVLPFYFIPFLNALISDIYGKKQDKGNKG